MDEQLGRSRLPPEWHAAKAGWKPKRDAYRSVLIFGGGASALAVADIYFASRFDDLIVANWAFLKSLALVVAPIASYGLGQALIRMPVAAKYAARRAAVSAAIGAVAALVIALFAERGLIVAATAGIAAGGYSAISVAAGYDRSLFRVSSGQILVHGWKFGVLGFAIIVALGSASEGDLLPVYAAIMVSFAAYACVRLLIGYKGENLPSPDRAARGELSALGRRFIALGVIAVAASYLDQILLNLAGAVEASANYFRYSSVLLPIPSFVAGFAGNLASPFLRGRPEKLRGRERRIRTVLLIASGVVAAMSVGIGLTLGNALGLFPDGPNVALVLALAYIGFMRVVYVWPSALIGVYGRMNVLDGQIVLGLAALVTYLVTFVALMAADLAPLWAVVVSTSTMVTIRSVGGLAVARSVSIGGAGVEG